MGWVVTSSIIERKQKSQQPASPRHGRCRTTPLQSCYGAIQACWMHVAGREPHSHEPSRVSVAEIPLISSTSTRFHNKNGFSMVCLNPLESLLMVQKTETRDWELILFLTLDPKSILRSSLLYHCHIATEPRGTQVAGRQTHSHLSSTASVGEMLLMS